MLSPTVTPEYLTSMEDVPADWLGEVVPALARLSEAYRAVANARGDIMEDVTKTPAARMVTMDQLWHQHVGPHVDAAGKALDTLNQLPQMIAQERTSVFPEPQDQAGIVVASEIRQALARLDEKDRRTELDKALASGDRKVMSAVVNAPTFLTGLSPETVNSYRHQFIANHYPEMDARLSAAHKVLDRGVQVRAGLRELRSTMFSAKDEADIRRATVAAAKAQRHLN